MSLWNKYTLEQRKNYEEFLIMYGRLSAMFNQKSSETGAPYLDSKFQETIYARSFDSRDVDTGNTPHDILSILNDEKYGIGIKTWLNSNPSYQKVMQLKSFKDEIDPFIKKCKDESNLTKRKENEEYLARKLSEIKNKKLTRDYDRLGLVEKNNYYHYVTRDEGKLVIQETTYPLVNINKIRNTVLNDKSFEWEDDNKKYKYTFGDSQIWMKFGENGDHTINDEIKVSILKDPFSFLRNAFNDDKGVLVKNKFQDALYLPLFSDRDKKVQEKSGLNTFFTKPKTKGSKKARDFYEAYISIPKFIWNENPYWLGNSINLTDSKSYENKINGKKSIQIMLHLPDGNTMKAIICQQGFKALQTNPQNILGKWLIRDILGFDREQESENHEPIHQITMEDLEKIGIGSVKIWHEFDQDYSGFEIKDPNKHIYIDVASIEDYLQFKKNEIPSEEN